MNQSKSVSSFSSLYQEANDKISTPHNFQLNDRTNSKIQSQLRKLSDLPGTSYSYSGNFQVPRQTSDEKIANKYDPYAEQDVYYRHPEISEPHQPEIENVKSLKITKANPSQEEKQKQNEKVPEEPLLSANLFERALDVVSKAVDNIIDEGEDSLEESTEIYETPNSSSAESAMYVNAPFLPERYKNSLKKNQIRRVRVKKFLSNASVL